jgi:small conductance mechanosensitive channel
MTPASSGTDDGALAEALQTEGVGAWEWATAGITLAVAIIVSVLVRWLVARLLERRLDPALAILIARVGGYVILTIGLVYALESLGVRIGPILGALGIAGIAIAFALKDILENFVAGVMLQLKRPFTYGDQVRINEYEGTVHSIDSRVVTIVTPDGETVMIPSVTVIKAEVNNYTQLGRRRTTVPVGVAYGTDLDRAREVLDGAVRDAEGVLDSPEPEVLIEAFGESSVDFVVRFWHTPTIAALWTTRHHVASRLEQALAEAEITIPFPQRRLWLEGGDVDGHQVDGEHVDGVGHDSRRNER